MFGSFTIESLDRTEEFFVTQHAVSVGRSGDNDLTLPFPTVSKHHACLSADESGCRVADLGSVNGTFVNGVELSRDEQRLLADGDVVRIGAFQLRYHAPTAPGPGHRPSHGVATAEVEARPGQTVVLPPNLPPRVAVSTPQWTREFSLGKAQLTIGRDADNDIVIPLVAVSRRHAVLERRGRDLLIRDLGSTNGVTVAGRRVSEGLLRPGDHASLGNAIGIQYLGAVDFAAEFVAEAVRRAAGSAGAADTGAPGLVEGVFFDDRALIGGATISFIDGELVCSTTPKLGPTVEGAVVAMGHVVESRDPYTAGHERRVAELAAPIAREMGLRGERLAAVRLAALIHDIGKMSVPAEILSKPGRLNDAEFNLVKEHPRAGYTIIEGIEFGPPVATMVLQHHERPDGSGYPQGLTAPEILLEARIIAVADVAEAMASHRPYRPALGAEAALEELTLHAGTRYDADAVAACVRLFQDQGFEFTE